MASLSSKYWRAWYALPFIENPHKDATFAVYFTPKWQESLKVSLYNFLSSVIHATPIPRFIFQERWGHADEQQKQKQLLSHVTNALELEECKVLEVEEELEKMKTIAKRFARVAAKDIKENSRKLVGAAGTTKKGLI